MPSVIDSLVVSLGFDNAGLVRGGQEAVKTYKTVQDASKQTAAQANVDGAAVEKLHQRTQSSSKATADRSSADAAVITSSMKSVRESAASTAKELESRGGQAAQFFGQIQNKVLALTGAVLGFDGLKNKLVDVTGATADLGRAAAVSGADIQQLAAFGNLIARNGGNAAAATGQVQGFISALENYKLFGQASDQFKIGLGTIGFSGDDTWLDVLKKAASYAGQNKDDPAKVSTILGGISINDNATLSELLKGLPQFNKDLDESRQLGIAEKGDADAARNLQEKFNALGQAVDQTARKFVTSNASGIGKFLDYLTDVFQGKYDPDGVKRRDEVSQIWNGIVSAPGRAYNWVTGKAPTSSSVSNTTFPTPAHAIGSPSDSLLELIRRDEDSPDDAVSKPAFPGSHGGAVGRYQITPATAKAYGFDPSRLKDPAYNEQVARAIVDDLTKKYKGDVADVLIAYNSTPQYVKKFNDSGRDPSVLLPETQNYLRRAQNLLPYVRSQSTPSASDGVAQASGGSSTEVRIDTIVVNTKATDAKGIAAGIRDALNESILADQANKGLN